MSKDLAYLTSRENDSIVRNYSSKPVVTKKSYYDTVTSTFHGDDHTYSSTSSEEMSVTIPANSAYDPHAPSRRTPRTPLVAPSASVEPIKTTKTTKTGGARAKKTVTKPTTRAPRKKTVKKAVGGADSVVNELPINPLPQRSNSKSCS